jgi:cellulose synthase operon protein C
LKYPVVIALSSLIVSSAAIAGMNIDRASDAAELQTSAASQPLSLPPQRTERLPQDPVSVAQTAPSTTSKTGGGASAPNAAPLPADLSALRYFARRGDTVRLQAETARLRALYPNWVPPENPLADQPGGDPQLDMMWKLFAEKRFDDLRKAIAERQKADSSWQVPEDLAAMLKQADVRQSLVKASTLQQYSTVIETASQNPSLLTCKDIDVLWMVAEAFAKTERPDRSRDTYGYILKNCTVPSERLATMQKASTLLSPTMLDGLLALEKVDTAGKPEFEGLRNDLARRFVANATENPDTTVPDVWLERLQKLAETDKRASDALLLGWYSFRHNAVSDAEKWFRMAREKQDSASTSQGLALVLQARKDFAAAEQVMYQWRDSSDEARSAYLAAATNLLAQEPPIAIESDVLQRMATETASAKDAESAQQFGWYARAFQQPQLALKWFALAVSWKPDDEPSAYGLAITADELKMPAEVSRIQRLWAARSARIAALGERKRGSATPAVPARRVAERERGTDTENVGSVAYDRNGQYPSPVRRERAQASCATAMSARNLSPDESLTQGWCLMKANRAAEAVEAFNNALNSSEANARSDAAYGKTLAYMRMGLTNNAAFAATNQDLSSAKATELQVALLADRAVASFQARRYSETINLLDRRARLASERVDLMVLRGYVYLNLKRYGDAKRVFQSLAAIGNRDGLKGLADVRNAMDPSHSG